MKMTVEQTAPMQTLAPKCKTSEVVSCCASKQERLNTADCAPAPAKTSPLVARDELQTFTAPPLALAIFVLDRITGEHRPLIPGLFERALAATERPQRLSEIAPNTANGE